MSDYTELVERLRAVMPFLPMAEFEVWTSNSWRRIYLGNKPAIEPCVQRDNHPDLIISSGVSAYLELVGPAQVALLLDAIAQLTRELDAAGADAQLGRAILTSGLYDCMNDFETDAEATVLIKRLIALAEPILDAEWNRRRALSAPNDGRTE